MKRVFYFMFLIGFMLTGCTKQGSIKEIKADDIAIYYGVSSYAMFGAEQTVINELLHQFSSLTFDKTMEELDLGSAFRVVFYHNQNRVKSYVVDKNGVFWIDGETQGYRAADGSFDYEYLKMIYEESSNSIMKNNTSYIYIEMQGAANYDI